MIKDVEFAFLAQLSYLNWNKITLKELEEYPEHREKRIVDLLVIKKVWNKIKRPNTIEPVERNGVLMYHETDKRLFGVFGIERDKKKPEIVKPYYNFDGWQFIYSADTTKLYKDVYNLEDIEDDGFYAVAFMKDDEIVVAYRGTDGDGEIEEKSKDIMADYEIGFLNRIHSQHISTHIFIEYIKKIYPEKNINITGHSLGGCLAQYAFVCTGKKYTTVTWNGLGLGNREWDMRKKSYINWLAKELFIYARKNEKKLRVNKIVESWLLECFSSEIKKSFISSETGEIVLGSEKESREKLKNILKALGSNEENNEIISIQQYWLLKAVKEVRKSTNSNQAITNYYNSKDWTALLQTRQGKIIDVLTGKVDEQELADDSKSRIIKETQDKFGFTYHGVNDFLMYMNSEGMIEAGKINAHFRKNLIKTLFIKALEVDNIILKDCISRKKILIGAKEIELKKFLSKLLNDRIVKNSIYKRLNLENARYKEFFEEVLKNYKDEKYYYKIDVKKEDRLDESLTGLYYIGEFDNIINLGEIKGGSEYELEDHEELIKALDSPKEKTILTERKILSEKDTENQVRGVAIHRRVYNKDSVNKK